MSIFFVWLGVVFGQQGIIGQWNFTTIKCLESDANIKQIAEYKAEVAGTRLFFEQDSSFVFEHRLRSSECSPFTRRGKYRLVGSKILFSEKISADSCRKHDPINFSVDFTLFGSDATKTDLYFIVKGRNDYCSHNGSYAFVYRKVHGLEP